MEEIEYSEKDLERKKVIDTYIEKRTSINKEDAKKDLQEVSELVKELNSYIDGILNLSQNSIDLKIDRLLSYFSFNLAFSFPADIALRRARKFDIKDSKIQYCYDKVQDLSYIPCEFKDIIQQGRFNIKGESRYYATIHFKDSKEKFFHTAISEIDGQKYEYINILDSFPTKRLNVTYIGIFDDFVRDKIPPKYVDEMYYTICQEFKKACTLNDKHIDIYKAFIICNAFLSDIVKRDSKTSSKLYNVTSSISSHVLKDNNFEAIIYESTKVKEEPSIVIKPQVVDKYIEHREALCCKIDEIYGYGMYDITCINESRIDNDDTLLDWCIK